MSNEPIEIHPFELNWTQVDRGGDFSIHYEDPKEVVEVPKESAPEGADSDDSTPTEPTAEELAALEEENRLLREAAQKNHAPAPPPAPATKK